MYDENASNKYLIILVSSLGLVFFLLIIVIAITPSNLNEEITVEVVEYANCVGGRRVYLCDLGIPNKSPDYYDKKYYAYFTSDYENLKLEITWKFNKLKYGEAFTTEQYRNCKRSIYNFKDDDFELIRNENKSA